MGNKKNLFIGALLVAIVAMSVGYAALAQTLSINGTANIDANWDIEITDINETAATGATTKEIDSSATSATFNVDLAYPGATATYEVNIENKGTINAVLDSVSGIDAANSAEPSEIQYTISGVNDGDLLNASDSTTATITVTWVKKADNTDSVPTATQKTATITLNYVQNT